MKTYSKYIFGVLVKATYDKEGFSLRDSQNHKNNFPLALSTVIDRNVKIYRFVLWRFMIEYAKFI